MIRKVFAILLTFSYIDATAQVTGLPILGEGVGVGFSLQQLKDSARQNNIAIRTARFSMDAARQQRKEAFTKYFPNVSGTGRGLMPTRAWRAWTSTRRP